MLRPVSLLALLALMAASSSVAWGDEPFADYFEALRQRGLYVVAEEYATSRLARTTLEPAVRAGLTVELANTLVVHGAALQGSPRSEMWAEAAFVLDQLLQQSPDNPRRMAVVAARVSLPIRQGLALAWDAQVESGAAKFRDQAVELLTASIPELRSLSATLAKSNPRLTDAQLADGALTPVELLRLSQEADLLIAKASLSLGEILPAGVPRTSALMDASRDLDQLLRAKLPESPANQATLLRARVARLQGDDRRASTLLVKLASSADREFRERALAEQLRLLMATGELDQAFQLVADRLKTGTPPSDEYRAAAVDVLLALWKRAGEKNEGEMQAQLLAEAEHQREMSQGHWRQWAASRIALVQEEVKYGPELASIVRDAVAEWQAGNVDQAAGKYGEAAAAARRLNRDDQAVELAMLRGSILVNAEHWPDAAATLKEIVATFPKDPRTPEASLLRCYALGRLYAGSATQANREQFEMALQDHLTAFRSHKTAHEAVWMLAAHQEQRLQWTEALPLYRAIPGDHPRFAEASYRILILYQKILERLNEVGGPVAEWEDQLRAEIARISSQLPADGRTFEVIAGRTFVLAAQLLLQIRQRDYTEADRLLAAVETRIRSESARAERSGSAISKEWTALAHQAAQSRIVSLAGQQRLEEARQLLTGLQTADADALLGILIGLTELTSKIDPQQQRELGRMQQVAVTELQRHRSNLTPQQQSLLDLSRAQAYIATGDLPEAADVYESLIRQSPRDRRLIRQVIAVYRQRGQTDDLEKARQWWVRLEQLENPGSANWVEARLNIADLLVTLGRKDEARKLLGVTRTLYPALATPELKAQGDAIWKRLDGR